MLYIPGLSGICTKESAVGQEKKSYPPIFLVVLLATTISDTDYTFNSTLIGLIGLISPIFFLCLSGL
jgi:hypothetical protein